LLFTPERRIKLGWEDVNVDEFAHTDVEQHARCGQLRVLAALSRCDRQRVPATPHAEDAAPTPTQAPAADVEPSMEVVDFCVAPSATLDSGTAISPPTHPAQLHDGGGADVGGVGSRESPDPRHRHRDKLPNREPADS
jgi:hypothetical protein